MLVDRLNLSERRACRIAGQNRSTQRHCPQVASDDAALRRRSRKISEQRPRWGYRRAHGHLLSEGFSLNRKRVQRIWREEGLRVPAKAKKRRRLGESTTAADRLKAEFPNHVWALDFQHDATDDGRELKFLNVVDEFTREALAIEVDRSIDAEETVAVLGRLAGERGAPANIRQAITPLRCGHSTQPARTQHLRPKSSGSSSRRGMDGASPTTAAFCCPLSQISPAVLRERSQRI